MYKNNGSVILSLLIGIPLLVITTIGLFVFGFAYGLDNYSKAIFYRNIGGNYYKSPFKVYYRSSEGGLGIFSNIKYILIKDARLRACLETVIPSVVEESLTRDSDEKDPSTRPIGLGRDDTIRVSKQALRHFSVVKDKENKPSQYGKDDKNVFYREKKVEMTDLVSFTAITSTLGRDKNAYFIGEKTASEYINSISDLHVNDNEIKFHNIAEFDPRLLEISSKYYLLVGSHPYLYPLDIIDYESFTPDVLKKGWKSGKYQYVLGKDKNFVYSFADNILNVKPMISNIAFSQDVSNYFIDFDGKLYLNGRLVNGQYRSGTLRKLNSDLVGSNYYKDDTYVYYNERKIEEADLDSFKVVVNTRQYPGHSLEYIADFAVDKNNKYHMG